MEVTVIPPCSGCGKETPRLCVCSSIESVQIKTKVLILQHPQEPDQELGTAQILNRALPNSVLRTGLSWPNLKAALYGKKPEGQLPITLPSEWGVLYFGSGATLPPKTYPRGLLYVDKKGKPLQQQKPLRGLIVLDGTWSQAKTLWWRNAWLLKLQRLILIPEQLSIYGKLRREPKRPCVSTLESVAYSLAELEKRPEIVAPLLKPMRALLEKVQSEKVGRA
jgi:DTW domain-containing protein YfiP